MDPQLVREVLALSTVVEVKDEWVRMFGWEQFVLPDAARSVVEGPAFPYPEHRSYEDFNDEGAQGPDAEGEGEDFEGEGEDDEEEEVVFVLDREPAPWSPERRQA